MGQFVVRWLGGIGAGSFAVVPPVASLEFDEWEPVTIASGWLIGRHVPCRDRVDRANPEFFRLSGEAISCVGSLDQAMPRIAKDVTGQIGSAKGPDREER